MSLVRYIKDKILYILVYEIYCLFMVLYLDAINVGTSEIILITAITTFIAVFIMFLNYNKKNRIIKELKQTIDKLDEKYLIGEIMKKPSNCELIEYYKILKLANKSMLDKIAQSQRKQKEYKEYFSKLVESDITNNLSQSCLETLAIIAYNQPCTKAIIEDIRGKDPTQTIQKLIDLGLVVEAGRASGPGRPLLFTVTSKFYDIFGIKNLSDLPTINLDQPFQDDDVSFFDTTRFND